MTSIRLYSALSLTLVLCLGACTPEAKQTLKANTLAATRNMQQARANLYAVGGKFAEQARENLYKTSYKVQEWAMTKPKPHVPSDIGQRYCYKSFHDILCYRAPLPGAEHRLVSYQGTHAEPPPQPVMTLLPTRDYDPSQQPASRVANARPVFVGLPPGVSPNDTPQEPEPIPADIPIEEIPEELPNPVLVPQL